jgi:hypothetical protein
MAHQNGHVPLQPSHRGALLIATLVCLLSLEIRANLKFGQVSQTLGSLIRPVKYRRRQGLAEESKRISITMPRSMRASS